MIRRTEENGTRKLNAADQNKCYTTATPIAKLPFWSEIINNKIKTSQVTVNLLDPPEIILRQLKVFRVHPLVERSHNRQRIIGVFQSKGMAQLMYGHQEQIITWRRYTLNITGWGIRESYSNGQQGWEELMSDRNSIRSRRLYENSGMRRRDITHINCILLWW